MSRTAPVFHWAMGPHVPSASARAVALPSQSRTAVRIVVSSSAVWAAAAAASRTTRMAPEVPFCSAPVATLSNLLCMAR